MPLHILRFLRAVTTFVPTVQYHIFAASSVHGEKVINTLVEKMNMPHVVEQLRKLEAYGLENEQKYPWMPSAWNRNH